jgi:hypothetical protein
MTEDQQNAFVERFVLSWEKLAAALEGLNETYRRQFEKHHPERPQRREAVVSRVQTEEDRLREAQGASTQPLNDWLSEVEDEEEGREFVGVREREWLDAHPGQKPEKAETGPKGD